MGTYGPCDRPGGTTVLALALALALVLSLSSSSAVSGQTPPRLVATNAAYPPPPATSYGEPLPSVTSSAALGSRPTLGLRLALLGWVKRHAAATTPRPESARQRTDDRVVRATRSDDAPAAEALADAPSPAEIRVTEGPPSRAFVPVRAAATVAGTAAPGLRIRLSGRGSVGEALRYLWVQTKGPEVRLDRADTPEISFIVPSEAHELAFQLIVAGAHGVDRAAVDVPLLLNAKPVLPALIQADAGDDQVAVVGHRVTLNAVRSRPRERLAYRWIQVDGPAVGEPMEESWTCSFVPTGTGLHRFILVVSADGVISKPDEVLISVLSESGAPSDLRGAPRGTTSAEALAKRLLTAVEPAGQHARDLAGAFEAVADRLPLYHSYADLYSETARRLGAILPADPAARDQWDEALFLPLSGTIVAALKALELDPSEQPEKALNPEHKKRLDALFREIARGFRSVAPPLPGE